MADQPDRPKFDFNESTFAHPYGHVPDHPLGGEAAWTAFSDLMDALPSGTEVRVKKYVPPEPVHVSNPGAITAFFVALRFIPLRHQIRVLTVLGQEMLQEGAGEIGDHPAFALWNKEHLSAFDGPLGQLPKKVLAEYEQWKATQQEESHE